LYEVAPLTEFHLRVVLVAMLVAPSAGDVRVGAAGGAGCVVVKLALDHPLVPPAFVALTLQ
jgi:anaerobic C4-dicarboxylate transporter